MNTQAHSPVSSDQHGETVPSCVDQMPDDYVVRRASNHVRDVLHSEDHSWKMPDTSSSAPSNRLPRKTSQTVGQIDTEKIVPPVDNLVPDKAKVRPSRTFTPTTEWEGYVESMSEEEFSVRLVNVRSQSSLPTDQATFHKDEVSEYDRQLLREGAIVRWVIGRERLSTGQVRNVSELYFRRLPAHSEEDYNRANEKACALLEGINWEYEAEGQ
ncbi:MAG: hypothetical protein OXG56_04515 [Gammaproteobacteria bacterium]|nr:hypothetical protein [Gammaproteobacteria bacterium]